MAGFPDGFLWGAATAAHQIEGSADTRGPSIWDRFSHEPGRTRHGDTADIACDHLRRYAEDLDLLADLGAKAYRFSIAWPRVLPDGERPINPAGLDFYRRLCRGLRDRGIAPVATLYHWDLPTALQDRGGWGNRESAGWFADYAEVAYAALGDLVDRWITLNEPFCAALLGHAVGIHAPGLRDPGLALTAAHHLLLAHGEAVARLRGLGARQVGITLNLTPVSAATDDPVDGMVARVADGLLNRLFTEPVLRGRYPQDVREAVTAGGLSDLAFLRDGDLERIAAPLDFLGVNYYESLRLTADPAHPQTFSRLAFGPVSVGIVREPRAPRTAMGWDIVPDGLTGLLTSLAGEHPGLPLLVTENGAAFDDYIDPEGGVDDAERVAYLDAHFRAAAAALAAGVDLRGYFVWSLLDNFEWAEGYAKRFGLVHVDYATQTRRPKASFAWYRDVIRRNGL